MCLFQKTFNSFHIFVIYSGMLLHAGPKAFITNVLNKFLRHTCWLRWLLRWLGAVHSVPTVQLIIDLRVVTACLAR